MAAAIKDLLPIGSIVLLEGGEKRMMIFGVKQADVVDEETTIEYDYISVVYPEGNMGLEYQFLFNHEDISEVVFQGYNDPEREAFLQHLDELYASGEMQG